MEVSEIIGLDVGTKRTGMARASSVAKIAKPLRTVPTDEILTELKKLIAAQPISAIVVGLPRNMSGQETDQSKWVRRWLNQLKAQLPVDFYFQDETLTTRQAEANQSLKTPVDSDSQAAVLILEDFFKTSQTKRRRF